MTQVLVAGIAVLDCVFEVSQMPASAEKHIAREAQWVVGGCAANAAIAISRLGGKAALAVQLGDDFAAGFICNALEKEGIDLSPSVRSKNSRSAVSSVFVDQCGERQIVNFRGDQYTEHANNRGDRSLFAHVEQKIAAILADSRWYAGALQAFELGRSLQIPCVLDAEAPIPDDLMQMATHIAFSRTGLLSLGRAPSLDQALLTVNDNLDAWVCVTDGAEGVYSVEDGQIRHHPAYPVKAVDTLGAGDVWHGAFSLQLAKGAHEAESICFANATAALKCMTRGGGAVTPDLAAVQAFMSSRT